VGCALWLVSFDLVYSRGSKGELFCLAFSRSTAVIYTRFQLQTKSKVLTKRLLYHREYWVIYHWLLFLEALIHFTDILLLTNQSLSAALGCHWSATWWATGGLPQKAGTKSKKTSQVNITLPNKYPRISLTEIPTKFPLSSHPSPQLLYWVLTEISSSTTPPLGLADIPMKANLIPLVVRFEVVSWHHLHAFLSCVYWVSS